MGDNPEFDSSDIEIDPNDIPLNPFDSHGRKSLDFVLANKESLRRSSKIAVKKLTSCHGAPGTRAKKARWKAPWEGFLSESLGKASVQPLVPQLQHGY